MTEVYIIAAVSENRVIGKDNRTPWRIPEDLKHFKELTLGHPVIMGRNTYESLGKPLPQRANIVVTRDEDFRAPGCFVYHTLEEAIEAAPLYEIYRGQSIFIIGGAQIYEQAVSKADRLFLTLVEGEFEGDAFFPDYSDFKNVVSESAGQSGDLKFRFIELKR